MSMDRPLISLTHCLLRIFSSVTSFTLLLLQRRKTVSFTGQRATINNTAIQASTKKDTRKFSAIKSCQRFLRSQAVMMFSLWRCSIVLFYLFQEVFGLYPEILWNPAPWRGHGIIPVIHNLESFQVPYIIDALDDIKCCTVSLRHATALESLRELTEQFGPYCTVGVSTVVSEQQIRDAHAAGAEFISTTFNAESLLVEAKRLDLPILCGALTYSEAKASLAMGADALKFYPSTHISPLELREVLQQLTTDGTYHLGAVPIDDQRMYRDVYVAGGVKETDFASYMKSGANGFAIGFDCKLMTPAAIRKQLKELTTQWEEVKQSITT